jgi:UPF0716 family protein affecting phage T7 exclusion
LAILLFVARLLSQKMTLATLLVMEMIGAAVLTPRLLRLMEVVGNQMTTPGESAPFYLSTMWPNVS